MIAAALGRTATSFSTTPTWTKAFSLNSPLSIQYAIDVVVPLLAAKTT